jgi:hypothetical protein
MNRASTHNRQLVAELNYLTRLGVRRFSLDSIPELCSVVERLKTDARPCTRQDVRQAIMAGIRSITEHDHCELLIGEWLFALPNESGAQNLTGRRNEVGRLIGRSASSIRQTDQPALLDRLAEFLETARAGFLSSGSNSLDVHAVSVDAQQGYLVRGIRLAIGLNPADYDKSQITVSFDVEATRHLGYFGLNMSLEPGFWHGLTFRSADGRLQLLPVGHPKRLQESEICYRIDPPLAPGERSSIRFRQRQLGVSRRLSLYGPMGRGLIIPSKSVEWIELSITTPAHRDYHPTWSEKDGYTQLQAGYVPRVYRGRNMQRYAVVISRPGYGRFFGIGLDEDLLTVIKDRKYSEPT